MTAVKIPGRRELGYVSAKNRNLSIVHNTDVARLRWSVMSRKDWGLGDQMRHMGCYLRRSTWWLGAVSFNGSLIRCPQWLVG
jgi:hypothetical protein